MSSKKIIDIHEFADEALISHECAEAVEEWTHAISKESQRIQHNDGDEFETSTVSDYIRCLKNAIERGGFDLTEISASEFNDLMGDFDEGTNHHVPDNGLSGSTVKRYQSAAKSFYSHHLC